MFAIKKMRQKAGLKQGEVAAALGIPVRTYGSYEREEREVSLDDAIRIAELFGCSLDELAGRDWGAIQATLTDEEREVLEAFRASDERGRGNISDTARREKSASEPDVVRLDRDTG